MKVSFIWLNGYCYYHKRCSKCPTLAPTHVQRRRHHSSIALSMTLWSTAVLITFFMYVSTFMTTKNKSKNVVSSQVSLNSCSTAGNTVCSASVSSSHIGHTFLADLAKAHLPPNDISTDTNIFGVGGHVAFWLLVVVAIISGHFL